jgi:predicted secreted hydrolase
MAVGARGDAVRRDPCGEGRLVRRREFLVAGAALLGAPAGAAEPNEPRFAAVVPGRALAFPRDHGAHPDYRNEWWYLTGWLSGPRSAQPRSAQGALGFQVTFFRSRPPFETANPSRFAPRELILAHAALADPQLGRLRHDQRAARAALGLAGAQTETTEVWIDGWRLALEGTRYRASVAARDFALELEARAVRPPLAQGEAGYSRKGRRPAEASHYYSRPQLAVSGRVKRGGEAEQVEGIAWLDHEWSSTLIAPEAAGWDWVGLNLADGGALMAFRMRGKDGSDYYAGGTLADAHGRRRTFAPGEVRFEPLRRWRSPRTATEYPVAMRISAGAHSWTLQPLLDDQELDARAASGILYWEGAVRALGEGGGGAGRGYLELTGYNEPLRF